MSITLTVTTRGRITLNRAVRDHLGVRAGDRVDVDLLPGERVQLRARRGTPISAIFGMLAKPGTRPRSIEELNEAIASGWAGKK